LFLSLGLNIGDLLLSAFLLSIEALASFKSTNHLYFYSNLYININYL